MANKYTVGRQLVAIQIVQGGLNISLPMNQGTSFEYTHEIEQKKRMGIDSMPSYKNFFGGITGSISATRLDSNLDDTQILLQDQYYNSIVDQNGSITITVINSDQSYSTYLFTDAAWKIDNVGPWTGDNYVDIKMSFSAATMQKLS